MEVLKWIHASNPSSSMSIWTAHINGHSNEITHKNRMSIRPTLRNRKSVVKAFKDWVLRTLPSRNRTLSETATRNRTLSETAARNRALSETAARNRALSETATRNRALSETAARNRTLSETAARNRALSETAARNRALSETAARNRALSEAAARNRALSETATRNRALSEAAARNRALSETATRNVSNEPTSVSNETTTRNSASNKATTNNSVSNETAERISVADEKAERNSVPKRTTRNSKSNKAAIRNSVSNETAARSSVPTTVTRNDASSEIAIRNDVSDITVSRMEIPNGTFPSSGTSHEASFSDEVTNESNCSTISMNMTVSKWTKAKDESDIDDVLETNKSNLKILPNDKMRTSTALCYQLSVECTKHPGHKEFIPIRELKINHLPQPYHSQDWVHFIQLKGMDTILVEVNYTSPDRPDDLGFVAFKGTTKKRTGSGTAFVMNMDKYEDCNCSEISGAHNISGCFTVMTVSHVVFNDEEAQNTVVTFFYEDENDMSTVVKARGVRVMHVDVQKNRSLIECRTHDLNLHQRLLQAQQKRLRLAQNSLADEVNHEPMALLISHPHGLSKRVSIGKLLSIEEDGKIKTNKDGVELIGCFLTYDTPTCPGTGGGSLNLIGNGEVCSAFAPHCASKSNGTNISGLGWTKYIKTMQQN